MKIFIFVLLVFLTFSWSQNSPINYLKNPYAKFIIGFDAGLEGFPTNKSIATEIVLFKYLALGTHWALTDESQTWINIAYQGKPLISLLDWLIHNYQIGLGATWLSKQEDFDKTAFLHLSVQYIHNLSDFVSIYAAPRILFRNQGRDGGFFNTSFKFLRKNYTTLAGIKIHIF